MEYSPVAGAVGNTDAHPHLVDVFPAADLIGCTHGLEVEVNDVPHVINRGGAYLIAFRVETKLDWKRYAPFNGP